MCAEMQEMCVLRSVHDCLWGAVVTHRATVGAKRKRREFGESRALPWYFSPQRDVRTDTLH